jgi:hypothetical protein
MPPRDKQVLFKRTDVRRAVRSVQDLGLPIGRVEIDRGKIIVIVGATRDDDTESKVTNNPFDSAPVPKPLRSRKRPKS